MDYLLDIDFTAFVRGCGTCPLLPKRGRENNEEQSAFFLVAAAKHVLVSARTFYAHKVPNVVFENGGSAQSPNTLMLQAPYSRSPLQRGDHIPVPSSLL